MHLINWKKKYKIYKYPSMNIHEHQAKEILKEFGAPISNGVVIHSIDEIKEKIKTLNSKEFVLKAQIQCWRESTAQCQID